LNSKQLACDPERIELFLNQQLGGAEQAEFEVHLDDCQDCRSQLETTAATEDIWTAIRDSLHSESPTFDSALTAAEASNWDGDGHSFSVDTVLQLLAPTDDDRMLGRLGTYEVVGVIGTGGMGVVLKAFDSALNRYVAIKILSPHLGNSGAARKRFSREAQAAAAVVHDNVIEIHGVADANGLPYLVMPYVPGPSLQKRLDDDGPLSLVEILRIAKQAATGLAEAHAQGLVHRDVKPANILLADGVERVKLTDFGLARAADDASLTKTGVIAGTPQFMSPEQARGEAVNPTSDLFGLGSVMYTMCTGRPPFRAETSYGILRRITDTEPRPIREINPDIPDWLAAIIAKLMSKQPDERFESAQEVADLLEECLAHVQQPATVALPKSVQQLPKFLPVGKPNQADRVSGRFGRKPWANALRLIVGAGLALAMLFSGILIVLELNKGTLTIESEVDDVPIKIMQGDKVVEKLTVTKDGASVRVAAGQYVVEIGGEFDGILVKDETVSVRRGGKEVVRIVKRPRQKNAEQPAPATPMADPMAELRRLQGVWMVNTCDSATKGFGDKLAVVRDWRWDVRGNEIVWARSHGKVWKMTFTIDPSKTPKEIDLTYLDGPYKGKKSLGRYRWGGIGGKTLWISVQDPGVDVPRPKSVGMRSGETSLILLDRPDAGQDLASLQGNWKFDIFYTDTLPKPKGKSGTWHLAPCVIEGNEMSWTGRNGAQIRMSFTIDPTKLPHEIDATFRSGPLKDDFSSPLLDGKCLGIYERRGSTLLLCLADPGSEVPRPKKVAYETLAGKTMIVLIPAARGPVREKKRDGPKRDNQDQGADRAFEMLFKAAEQKYLAAENEAARLNKLRGRGGVTEGDVQEAAGKSLEAWLELERLKAIRAAHADKPAIRGEEKLPGADPKDEPLPEDAGQSPPGETETPLNETPLPDTPVPEPPRDPLFENLSLKQQVSLTDPPLWVRNVSGRPDELDWPQRTGPLVLDNERLLIGQSILDLRTGKEIGRLPLATDEFAPTNLRLSADRKF
jgi:uncharacterized protein (TIGR03067 family)